MIPGSMYNQSAKVAIKVSDAVSYAGEYTATPTFNCRVSWTVTHTSGKDRSRISVSIESDSFTKSLYKLRP